MLILLCLTLFKRFFASYSLIFFPFQKFASRHPTHKFIFMELFYIIKLVKIIVFKDLIFDCSGINVDTFCVLVDGFKKKFNSDVNFVKSRQKDNGDVTYDLPQVSHFPLKSNYRSYSNIGHRLIRIW